MAAGGSSNMARMRLSVPPCPLRDAPNPVLMKLARSIDTVNNNDGHGCMILAELLGCSPPYIHSIMTRAERDSRNGFSPTMVLFSDLRNIYNPVFTLRDIERVLLQLNLEAVTILYSNENRQKIRRAYCEAIGNNHSLDINTEHSMCDCLNCLHGQSYNTPNSLSHHNAPQRQQAFSKVLRADHSGRMFANATETIQSTMRCESIQFEHPTHGTVPPLFIPQNGARIEGGPRTAPPHIQSQEERNMYMMRHFTRQMSDSYQPHGRHSESLNTFSGKKHQNQASVHPYQQNIPAVVKSECTQGQSCCGERTVRREFNNEASVTECISPEDNCHVDDEEVHCTCGISSSEFLYSNLLGNNQGQQQTLQHSECTCYSCSLPDETFVKSSCDQEAIDYNQCTCHSPVDFQNNNIPNSVRTSNEHSNHAVSSALEHIYFRESKLNRRKSQSQLDVEDEQREHHNMDNKRSSMDETKTESFCNGRENSNYNCSLNPCQHGPSLSVFVTYSRHSLEHVQEVIELCRRLKRNGIRVRVDFSGDQALDLFKNKHDWLDAYLKIARYVLVCISPTYYEDSAPHCNTEPIPDVNRLDVRYIFDHLRTEYHRNCSQNMRVIPVIFENSGASRKHLPSCMATTYVYNYPRQVNSIIEFILQSTPPAI